MTHAPERDEVHPYLRRWPGKLFASRDIAGLVFIRIGLGIVAAGEAVFRMTSGEAAYYYADPVFRFSYPGFGWLPHLDERSAHALLAIMAILGLGIAAGLFYRVSTIAYLAVSGIFLFYDRSAFVNHFYLLWLLILLIGFMPAHRAWSVDAWRGSSSRSHTAPTWCYGLLRYQIGLVYFFAGLAKLRWDWLRGRPAIFMWNGAVQRLEVLEALPTMLMTSVITIGGLIIDLGAVPLLLWRPTRPFAFAAVVAFHVGNMIVFSGEGPHVVGAFPWLMLVATTAFFEPDWPRRWFRIPQSAMTSATDAHSSSARAAMRPGASALLFLLGSFAFIQLVLPLRYLAYPGPTVWTKEGTTFAWQMMSHHQYGAVRFIVTHAPTGKEWVIRPHMELTRQHAMALAGKPSLQLDYARYLAARFARRGFPGCEVRADTLASLNGRPLQRFVDPEVDLSKAGSVWGHCSWVLPIEHDLPALNEAIGRYEAISSELRQFYTR